MKNIFENAYFGKVYKTRDGRKAIYWRKMDFGHRLIGEELHCSIIAYDDGKIQTGQDNKVDIVSDWQEEINEEELKIKAQRAAMKYHPKERESGDPEMDSIIRNVYMDCYIDCFNEQSGGKE